MKKIIFIITFSSIFLFSCKKEEIQTKKIFETQSVATGSIEMSQNYVGYVQSENEVNIGPKIGGKVILLNKNIGDSVKSGELIAQVDSSEASSNFSSNVEIINSLENLKNSTIESYQKQIQSNQEKINQLKKSIEISQINIENTTSGVIDTELITQSQIKTVENQIIQAQNGLDIALLNLENTKTTLKQKEIDMYTNSNNAINNAIILGNNVIDFYDNIYGVTQKNKNKNDNFEIYLSAKDSKFKTQGEILLGEIIKDFENLKNFSANNEKQYTLQYLNIAYELFNNKVTNFLNISYKVMENSVENTYLPQSTINDFKQKTTEFQTKNQSLILTVSGNYIIGLKGSIDMINSFENEKKSTLDMLEKQVINAENQLKILQETLNNYKAQSNSSNTQIGASLLQAKKQKEILESQLHETNLAIEALNKKMKASIDEINTQISQVKAGKNTSGIMIENSKVYANFDGIITKKYVDLGQVIGGGTPIYQISSYKKLKVEVLVGEEIEKNISIGEHVNIEIDGISNLIKGTVKNIHPSKDLITKKTIVEIQIPKNDDIKIGSYTKVYFNIKNENNGIIIPNSAILEKYLIPGVYTIKDNKAIFKKIEIIYKSNNFSQINGLQVGEIIITKGKENIYDGEILYK